MSTADSPSLERGSIFEIQIDSLAHGGSGVGRADGVVFFVPFAAPGDKVRVAIEAFKKTYATARIIDIIERSPHRREPPCKVFYECGGCQWQHINYAEQVAAKESIVRHALARIGREDQVEIRKIIPSPSEWNYRNRAQFRTIDRKVGFFKRNSHDIVDVDYCHIIEEGLNDELQKIRGQSLSKPSPQEQKIEVFNSKDGIFQTLNRGHSVETGFSQVNTAQNENLVALVTQNVPSQGAVLDLYCGNGNFSFPAAEKTDGKLLGIDLSRAAIAAAQKQAAENSLKEKATFKAVDCVLETQALAKNKAHFQTIILDPPRIGCDEKIWKPLVALGAEKMIYISCDPSTFSRDWARLKVASNSRYKIEFVQPFDMFPQTFHVELVCVISRNP